MTWEIFDGPENWSFENIRRNFSSGFIEVRILFSMKAKAVEIAYTTEYSEVWDANPAQACSYV